MLRLTSIAILLATVAIALTQPAYAGKGGGGNNLSQEQLLLLYAASHKPGPDNSQVGVSPFVPPPKPTGGGGGQQQGGG